MRSRWLLIIVGPALVLMIGSVLGLFLLPHPVPKTATRAQRLYLTYCAECHGANGRGSWRSTLLRLHPPDFSDPRTLASLSDEYLVEFTRSGGAPFGKPGMPAFGYHLSDEQIREVVRYVRALAQPSKRAGSGRPGFVRDGEPRASSVIESSESRRSEAYRAAGAR